MSTKDIVILDNGLATIAEHSYKLNLNVSRELTKRGWRYKIYSTANVDRRVAAELHATPHFQRGLYDCEYYCKNRGLLGKLARVLMRQPTRGRDEIGTFETLNKSYREDLCSLPRDTWISGRRVVIPAISQNQLFGLAMFLTTQRGHRDYEIVAQLMFNPDWVPWGNSVLSEGFYRKAFGILRSISDKKLTFTTENPMMSSIYEEKFGIKCGNLPVPLNIERTVIPANKKPKAGFFGSSKTDKGFHLIPGAIEYCRCSGSDIDFVVQVHHSGWEPATVAADQQLRNLKGVQILEGPLSDSAYADAFSAVDMILLPYDPVRFGLRGSGVFTQAASAGIPTVASTGTWAGRSIIEGAVSGETFDEYNCVSFASALLRLRDRLSDIKNGASKLSGAFAREHSVERYVDIITADLR